MQKGGNVKNVKMFCALLASNDERTLHLLAPPGDNLRCALRANSCHLFLSFPHIHSVTHSLISSPFWPCPFGGCQAKCSHKYVNVRYVSVPEMPAATANQAKWLHSQSCRRPRPIPIGHPLLLLHMSHLTWHFVQLVCVSINLLSLSLASRI